METTRVEDKEFAACKAAIKIYLQQNKGHSRPQSIDYLVSITDWQLWLNQDIVQVYQFVIFITDGYRYFFKIMLEATLMAGSLCFADLLLWPPFGLWPRNNC